MKFEPKKTTIDFEFTDKLIYKVDPKVAASKYKQIQELTSLNEEISKALTPEGLSDMCKNIRACIDMILEKGASKAIQPEDNYNALEDIFLFLDYEIAKFQKERLARIADERKMI